MPKTASKFGAELQATLQPMVLKPQTAFGTAVGFPIHSILDLVVWLNVLQTLQESVACICVVVNNLTHDYIRLVRLLASCNGMYLQKAALTDLRPRSSVTGCCQKITSERGHIKGLDNIAPHCLAPGRKL